MPRALSFITIRAAREAPRPTPQGKHGLCPPEQSTLQGEPERSPPTPHPLLLGDPPSPQRLLQLYERGWRETTVSLILSYQASRHYPSLASLKPCPRGRGTEWQEMR